MEVCTCNSNTQEVEMDRVLGLTASQPRLIGEPHPQGHVSKTPNAKAQHGGVRFNPSTQEAEAACST